MDFNEAIKRHVAGATVVHESPFLGLISLQNEAPLSKSFLQKWISPFYMRIQEPDEALFLELLALKPEISADIITQCLGDFNWRTLQMGAYFAAITHQTQFIETIGTHLLKSEVCSAGSWYCRIFAAFNTPQCVDYLSQYLAYYLTQTHLYFDQSEAMAALLYLDEQNGTSVAKQHEEAWNAFQKVQTAVLNMELFKQHVSFIQKMRTDE
jgi:Family of unknown function (DUF6000)